MDKRRLVTGVRPTGRLHLGHLVGQIRSLLPLQSSHQCFLEIADWHALTNACRTSEERDGLVVEVAADWIAAGVDPQTSVLFVQSQVPEHAELSLLLSMLLPVTRSERVPAYREKSESNGDWPIFGLLGYPVLQAAGILMYKAQAVPAGEDQLPHLELCRELARRFNRRYGETFPEPEAVQSVVPRLPGTDGTHKMSKSLGNTIDLAHTAAEVRDRLTLMPTDPIKVHAGDPGRPEACAVFACHRACNAAEASGIASDCRLGSLGCAACKTELAGALDRELAPIRERRQELLGRPERLRQLLHEGALEARHTARQTMREVRERMGLGRSATTAPLEGLMC